MLLKSGMQGPDVTKIQKILGLSGTGIYGPKTESAVREFQNKNGLTVTGIVDKKTWDKLNKVVVEEKSNLTLEEKIDKLVQYIPKKVLDEIPEIINKFKINTPLRLSHFLSQCAHESGNFRIVNENLNYSTEGLLKTFGKYFPTRALAQKYQRNPQKIANRVYSNRMGNGSERSGDGFKYRGRGFIQLTGKNNYKAFGDAIGEDLLKNPDRVSTEYPLTSAAWFFSTNRLNEISDRGSTNVLITEVSKRVNGGTNGLNDRISYFKKFYKILK